MRSRRIEHGTMKRDKSKMLITILSISVAVLVLFILFFFVARPQFANYSMNKQIEGANFVYSDIVAQVQQNGYFSMPVGNQTLILVPYNPQQAQGQALEQQPVNPDVNAS